jgi:hypothetical protein
MQVMNWHSSKRKEEGHLSILFYNNSNGANRLYNVDDQGHITQVNATLNLGSGWTHIVPCSVYSQQLPYNLVLLCYNKNNGAAKFFSLDNANHLTQLSSTTYSTGWTHIIHGFFAEASSNESLLFYNANSGLAQFYGTDGQGGINQLSSSTYSKGWTHIVPGWYTVFTPSGPGERTSDLLFYNGSSGLAQFYGTDGQGGINQISSSTYSTGWTHIISGIFVAGYTNTALFFYNGNSGLAQFYTTNGQGGIKQLSSSTYSRGWAQIVDFPGPPSNIPDTGNPDRLLFYNSGSGLAQVYITDNHGGINELSNNNVYSGWSQAEWLANS